MEDELKIIRDKLSLFESKIISLINERINLGNDVANIKFKYLSNSISFNNDTEILEYITNKDVEENILKRLQNSIKDETLSKIIVELYRNYIIPKTKERQIQRLKELKS